ncbi:MAG: LuxR C-terminal-related transcriptional regulator [Chthoniobacterales bacterium]
MEKVYELWDELDRFPAGETDAALRHLALRLKELLRADNVKWMAAVRVLQGAQAKKDPLFGWRLRASYDLVPDPEHYTRLIAPMYHRNNRLDPSFLIGLATHAIVAGAGKFRVHRMRDGWIPFREFSRSEHYRLHYTELGITDRMWISFPLNANVESVFLIDTTHRSRRFDKKDALLVGTILRGMRGIHRRLVLNHGLLIAETPLSPVFQRIVQKLLSGLSEKEIAAAMHQNDATIHKYVSQIYRRFGVNSRAALMALWLGQG